MFKIMPTNTLRISDLKDPSAARTVTGGQTNEDLAKAYDVGNKGFLTLNEAYKLYADRNQGAMPSNMQEVSDFLGGVQHPVTMHLLDRQEVLSLPWVANDWKGDFNVPGLGAGNVRVGGYYNWERPQDPKAAVVFIDCNLMGKDDLEKKILGASLVMGPAGFQPEAGSSLAEEAIELPLTLVTDDAHTTWTRGGSGFVPERKYMAAAIDIDDLRDLGGGTGVSFYIRLETTDGQRWINRDGAPGANFDVSDADLKKYAGI